MIYEEENIKMLELITMSLLGVSYIAALSNEAKEEKALKEKERIRDLKIKVFCYAVRHNMLYNEVVEKLQKKELSFEDINND
jgi:autonomous glycyl radical cofactor GrcA